MEVRLQFQLYVLLTLNEIEFKDIFRVVWKESRVALLCGITLAVCNFGKLIVVDGAAVSVSLTVCLTLIVTVFVAKVVMVPCFLL